MGIKNRQSTREHMAMKILKASPGLDPENLIGKALGPGFEVAEFDTTVPLTDQVHDVEVLLVRDVPVPAQVIDAAPKLKLLQRPGQHLVGVDVKHATARGIYVARIPSDISDSGRKVAEHAFFLLMALAKKYKESAANIFARKIGRPATHAVSNKTLGLVGVGKTGGGLARLANAFGMRVIAVKRTIDRSLEKELELAFLGDVSQLGEVLAQSDFVSIHLPLEPGTVNFFGRREFAMMKPSSFLINIARGPIIEKAALYEALTKGRLSGAALDVFWEEPPDPSDPLLCLDNVIATPHIAGATVEGRERTANIVAENIRLVANGKSPKYVISCEE